MGRGKNPQTLQAYNPHRTWRALRLHGVALHCVCQDFQLELADSPSSSRLGDPASNDFITKHDDFITCEHEVIVKKHDFIKSSKACILQKPLAY